MCYYAHGIIDAVRGARKIKGGEYLEIEVAITLLKNPDTQVLSLCYLSITAIIR